MKRTLQTIAIGGALLSSGALTNLAHANNFAIGANLSSQGYGLEGRAKIADSFFIRGGVNYFGYQPDGDAKIAINNVLQGANLNVESKVTLFTVPILVDYHPFEDNGFRLSAGVAYNGNKFELKAKSVTFNGQTLTNEQIKQAFNFDISGSSVELQLGSNFGGIASLGYDNSLLSNSSWSFNADFGVMYSGPAKVKVKLNDSIKGQLKEDLNKDLNSKSKQVFDILGFFPIASVGFKYNF